MGVRWHSLAVLVLLTGACNQKASSPSKPASSEDTIGNQITMLEFNLGSIWGGGYHVRVLPGEYFVLEHKNCSQAKREIGGSPDPKSEGLCIIRLNQRVSDQFETAMRPYRKYAMPLASYSFGKPDRRPDGKPCRNEVTDQQMSTLIWTSTEESQIATFYAGCDPAEYASFYESLRHVTDSLPIQGILAEH